MNSQVKRYRTNWECDSYLELCKDLIRVRPKWNPFVPVAFEVTFPSKCVKMMDAWVLVWLLFRRADMRLDAAVETLADTVRACEFSPIDWKIKRSHRPIAAKQPPQWALPPCELLFLVRLYNENVFQKREFNFCQRKKMVFFSNTFIERDKKWNVLKW